MKKLLVVSLLFILLLPFIVNKFDGPPAVTQIDAIVVKNPRYPDRALDLASENGFQDSFGGHLKRGRALLAADFDLDGRLDFYLGNPGDESFILHNIPDPAKGYIFKRGQTLLNGDLAWGGVTGDFDNDGDYDIFTTSGANEGIGFDAIFRNDFVETGDLHFSNLSAQARIGGVTPPGTTAPVRTASANARLADYDQDGDVDIFVSTNRLGIKGKLLRMFRYRDFSYSLKELLQGDEDGQNILWRNDGDFTFTDVTREVGLASSISHSRHSSWLDIDNDGDMDLFENNMGGKNVLWRNQIAETGQAIFVDVTQEMSPPGEDLSYPIFSFASGIIDFNNDGWEDLIVFYHHKPSSDKLENGPYRPGHGIFINQQGQGFKNIAESTGINKGIPLRAGVMGCQVGDISGDGYPDIFFGNGDPHKGTENQLFISQFSDGQLGYENASSIIDFPAQELPGIAYPPYPYRTHGSVMVDIDDDGFVELLIANGGPALMADTVREPNRLFKFDIAKGNFLKVQLKGDGRAVSGDAIGSRLALTYTSSHGENTTQHRTLHGSNAFSAHNSFTSHFYTGQKTHITSLSIVWPNGAHQTISSGFENNSTRVIEYTQANSD